MLAKEFSTIPDREVPPPEQQSNEEDQLSIMTRKAPASSLTPGSGRRRRASIGDDLADAAGLHV